MKRQKTIKTQIKCNPMDALSLILVTIALGMNIWVLTSPLSNELHCILALLIIAAIFVYYWVMLTKIIKINKKKGVK